jgi:gluconate 2-dehydrogenase gamma chain
MESDGIHGARGSHPPSRREFLETSSRVATGGWLALHLSTLAGLAACGREAAERGDPLVTLTAREAEAFGALAETILPSDDLPGAREAGVVHFVDLALDRHFPAMLDLVRPGLEDLDRRATERAPGSSGFGELPLRERGALLREIEDTPFFFLARLLTVAGMFSDPAHGGNRNRVGWEVLRMEHAPAFEPPFGFYDTGYGDGDAT